MIAAHRFDQDHLPHQNHDLRHHVNIQVYRNEEEVGSYVEGKGNFETENAMQFRGRWVIIVMMVHLK